jgi:hypothetical protein
MITSIESIISISNQYFRLNYQSIRPQENIDKIVKYIKHNFRSSSSTIHC